MGWLILIVILLIVLIILLSSVKIVPQATAMVVERLGGYRATWSVGLHVKAPFIDRVARKVILKERSKRISNGRRLIAVLQRHISVRMKMTRQRMYSWTRLIRSQEMRTFMMPVSSFIWIQTRHLRFRNFSMTLMILYRNSCQNMILTDQHTVWMIKRHMMMYSR